VVNIDGRKPSHLARGPFGYASPAWRPLPR
jgi:hypothetical protein